VEALSAIRGRRDRETLLLIAGQNPPAGGVPAGVIFTGPVPHAKMPALLSAADAVLSPSTYESFGLVPLEAMAAGVPVIVPRDGHWGDAVAGEGGGVAYIPDRSGGLAEAMAAMTGDAAARDRMAGEGKRIAARFTWERCTDSWARLLSSAARRDNRR
jgi:glycosyltransferase involved in cell wall biosynthesis